LTKVNLCSKKGAEYDQAQLTLTTTACLTQEMLHFHLCQCGFQKIITEQW